MSESRRERREERRKSNKERKKERGRQERKEGFKSQPGSPAAHSSVEEDDREVKAPAAKRKGSHTRHEDVQQNRL